MYLVQSQASGAFLVPGPLGLPVWESRLSECGGGVCDLEMALQLVEDHCDLEDRAVLVDLAALTRGE